MTEAGADFLAHHAARIPARPAVVDEHGRSRSYAELHVRANRCANALAAQGLEPGDRCLHIAHNRIEGFELGHALRRLGAVSTPVNPRLRGEEIAHLLVDSGAALVVAAPELVEQVEMARGLVGSAPARRWLVYGPGLPPAGWASYEGLLAAAPDTDRGAGQPLSPPTMMYTAGTTGRPKGAHRPQGADPSVVLRYIQLFDLRPDDVHLLAGPGYHSAPAAFAAIQSLLGATTVVMERFDAERALALIARHRVTTSFMAPILVKRIVDLPERVRARHDVSSMRSLAVAAAPFPADLKRRAVACFGETVHEFYGSTETGVVAAIGPGELLRWPRSCGRPVEGVEVRLLDDRGGEAAAGEPGEVWVRSPALATGYFNHPEATAEAFDSEGFFRTGDIARRDGEGHLEICDRRADLVISGGVNVYPAEVEAVLHAHPAVEDVAVIGVPDARWGESLKALVKLREGARATAAQLIAVCGEHLAGFKRPRSVDFVDELPRDAAGKLLKRLIREPYWAAETRRI